MIAFGLDPDLHNTGWAIVDSNGPSLLDCGVVKIPNKFKRREAAVEMAMALAQCEFPAFARVVIEGQECYLGKGKAKPQDLIHLAHVSGAATTLFVGSSCVQILLPKEISGVPKHIRQARAFKKLGIEYKKHSTKSSEWCVPTGLEFDVTQGQWKHVADAIAIALFAATT